MKTTKPFWIILSILFLFSGNSILLSQKPILKKEINPAFQDWKNRKYEKSYAFGHPLGEIPNPYKINVELPDYMKRRLEKYEVTPESFDLRTNGKVTSVKDQGHCGSCWAFATMGSIESGLLINEKSNFDFSEDNLNTCHPPFIVEPCQGGNTYISAAYLLRGSGPISEVDDPYDDTNSSFDCPQGLNPQGIITNAWFLPTEDPELIKNMIMEFGALATNFYYTDAAYNS